MNVALLRAQDRKKKQQQQRNIQHGARQQQQKRNLLSERPKKIAPLKRALSEAAPVPTKRPKQEAPLPAPPAPPSRDHPDLRVELTTFQREALPWIARREVPRPRTAWPSPDRYGGGLFFDDMGLGAN